MPLYSPTQVGKTDAGKTFIREALYQNIPIIISCDNKFDQLDQFYERVAMDISDDVTLLLTSDKNFRKVLQKCLVGNKKFVVFCMDNSTQLGEIKHDFASIMTVDQLTIKKICVLIDEVIFNKCFFTSPLCVFLGAT